MLLVHKVLSLITKTLTWGLDAFKLCNQVLLMNMIREEGCCCNNDSDRIAGGRWRIARTLEQPVLRIGVEHP
jgi:hypothetical protein